MRRPSTRERTCEPGHRNSILEGDDGRNPLHLELPGEIGVRIHIEFGEFEGALVLVCEALERGSEHSAWSAPLGPEVDDYRRFPAAFDDIGREARGIDVLDMLHGVTG